MRMKIGTGVGDIGGAPADVNGIFEQTKRAEADGFASAGLANIFGFEKTHYSLLVVQRTPTPYVTVLDLTLERWVLPIGFGCGLDRYDVQVGHQKNGL